MANKTINNKYVRKLPQFPSKAYPIPDQNKQSLYPFSDQNVRKNPNLWGGTYLYGLYRGLPPGGSGFLRLGRETSFVLQRLILFCETKRNEMY